MFPLCCRPSGSHVAYVPPGWAVYCMRAACLEIDAHAGARGWACGERGGRLVAWRMRGVAS